MPDSMKLWSQYFIPTLKESPADAEIPSHKLLIRAGLVRKLGGGLYTFLPLGLRVTEVIAVEPSGCYSGSSPSSDSSSSSSSGLGVALSRPAVTALS